MNHVKNKDLCTESNNAYRLTWVTVAASLQYYYNSLILRIFKPRGNDAFSREESVNAVVRECA